jgi:hypothetical protein
MGLARFGAPIEGESAVPVDPQVARADNPTDRSNRSP